MMTRDAASTMSSRAEAAAAAGVEGSLLPRESRRAQPAWRIARALLLVAFALLASTLFAAPARNALRIYLVDVEGGQATLFVTPSGQSMLVDTGWPGFNGRDAGRIVAAAKDAGVSKIDYLVITHYHRDHVGGFVQLADRIPIAHIFDHGENREPTDASAREGYEAFQRAIAAKHIPQATAKPGDVFPIKGMRVEVVSADGNLISKPLPGAGAANPACEKSEHRSADTTENARSLGTVITFGKLRILDLGDLTWDKEMELECPNDRIGHVDLYIVSHHGIGQSNSPALVDAVAPRVALMDNGATKGGAPSAWEIIKNSPRLEDLWQLHFSEAGGPAHNVAESFIANPAGPDAGNYLEVTAQQDGSFYVFNSRTRQTKHYAAK